MTSSMGWMRNQKEEHDDGHCHDSLVCPNDSKKVVVVAIAMVAMVQEMNDYHHITPPKVVSQTTFCFALSAGAVAPAVMAVTHWIISIERTIQTKPNQPLWSAPRTQPPFQNCSGLISG